MEVEKGVNACRDNDASEKPGHDRTSFLCGFVEFYWQAEKSCDRFPPFIWGRAVKVGTPRLFRQLLNFCERDSFARFLWQGWRRRLGRRTHLQRLCFARIEPDKFANFTDFNFDSTAAIECDFDHRVAARRTRPCCDPLVVNGMEPERVDRLGSESAA